MILDVSAQSLRPGDVVHAEMVSLRVARTWSTQVGTDIQTRVIHVVWEHLDLDHRMTRQYLPGIRFEVERPEVASDQRSG